jgi:hypothetical protein
MKSIKEIEDMLDKAYNMEDFSGMTYKEGVEAALMWVLEHNDDDPTE